MKPVSVDELIFQGTDRTWQCHLLRGHSPSPLMPLLLQGQTSGTSSSVISQSSAAWMQSLITGSETVRITTHCCSSLLLFSCHVSLTASKCSFVPWGWCTLAPLKHQRSDSLLPISYSWNLCCILKWRRHTCGYKYQFVVSPQLL